MSLEKCVEEDISFTNKKLYNKDLYTLIEEKIEGQFVNYCLEKYGPDYEEILKEKNISKISILNEMNISVGKEIYSIAKKAVGLATPLAYLKGEYHEAVDINFDIIEYLLPKIKLLKLDEKIYFDNVVVESRRYKYRLFNGGYASSSKKIVKTIKKYFNPFLIHYKQKMRQ